MTTPASGLKSSNPPLRRDTAKARTHDHTDTGAAQAQGTRTVSLGDGVIFGGRKVMVIAGPCAVETPDQVSEIAALAHTAGASVLRGGVYKLRTSPDTFQGLGDKGFAMVADVCRRTGMKFVTEAVDEHSLALVDAHADMIQIGTRNMHNTSLLKAAGKCKKPVMLKRGFAATLEEFLSAADYILSGGNENVVLCERGIRTFCAYTRFTLDLNIVPAIKQRSPLPVIVDPSHGTGLREFVEPMALAAIACGADGVMVEVHGTPQDALSDGRQSLYPEQFAALMHKVRLVAQAVGRTA